MSAGICIMNKQAIAMAADSAVMIGNHEAIHNSANKLFSLSRIAPVGLIIYANSTLMNVPVEIIVKEYKRNLGDKTFPHLKDYVDDFLEYIQNNSDLFRFKINEDDYVMSLFSNLMCGLLGDYRNYMEAKEKELERMLTDEEKSEVGERAYLGTIMYVASLPPCVDNGFTGYIKNKYLGQFRKLFQMKLEYSWLTDSQVNALCEKSCELFDTIFDRNNYVGIAIAGYGEEEIYPHMRHLHISGCINGRLRYYELETVEICENNPASVIPLAQTDVMQTFLFGINDRSLRDLSQELPRQIAKCMENIDDSCFVPGKKSIVYDQINSLTEDILKHTTEIGIEDYMKPIILSVSSLPIEELGLLAESMINITSLRRKVALDQNIGTVGGPIDVSIITKSDGFIWLKRKHYFDRKYNPQYYYSHYGRMGESGNEEEKV